MEKYHTYLVYDILHVLFHIIIVEKIKLTTKKVRSQPTERTETE